MYLLVRLQGLCQRKQCCRCRKKQFLRVVFDQQLLWRDHRLVSKVEGNPKAPIPIATTPKCREVCYSFPWIAPLYL